MIPKVMHHNTHTKTWSEMHIIRRTRRLMPDYKFFLWDDVTNLALFKEYFPELVSIYQGFTRGVIRADIARCLYLHKFGGIYADTDYKFFRRLSDAYIGEACILGVEDPAQDDIGGIAKLGNAFMASEPNFPLWLPFVKSIFERHRAGEKSVVFLSGPHALSKYLDEHTEYRSLIKIVDQSIIYPSFRRGKFDVVRTSETIGAHFCWGSWRDKKGISRIRNVARRLISALI